MVEAGNPHWLHPTSVLDVMKCFSRRYTKSKKNNTRDSNVVPHRSTQSHIRIGCIWSVLAEDTKSKKNNTRDSNVVPHRSTNLARQCLTSLSRREAVLSLWYGRSWHQTQLLYLTTVILVPPTISPQSPRSPRRYGTKYDMWVVVM